MHEFDPHAFTVLEHFPYGEAQLHDASSSTSAVRPYNGNLVRTTTRVRASINCASLVLQHKKCVVVYVPEPGNHMSIPAFGHAIWAIWGWRKGDGFEAGAWFPIRKNGSIQATHHLAVNKMLHYQRSLPEFSFMLGFDPPLSNSSYANIDDQGVVNYYDAPLFKEKRNADIGSHDTEGPSALTPREEPSLHLFHPSLARSIFAVLMREEIEHLSEGRGPNEEQRILSLMWNGDAERGLAPHGFRKAAEARAKEMQDAELKHIEYLRQKTQP